MSKYKYILTYDDGNTMDSYEEYSDLNIDQAVFESCELAEEAALYAVSCTRQGQEELHMGNPGDYDEEVDVTYEIVEIDD